MAEELFPDEVSEPKPQPDAVVLLVHRIDSGIGVEPSLQGDVRVTEVETLIKLGLKQWRNNKDLNVPD